MKYRNRQDAGRRLADVLRHYANHDTVVLALPRGGVVVGAEVARGLRAPLGVILVRKIGHPFSPEYAIGAIAEDTIVVMNQTETASIDNRWIERAIAAGREVITRRRQQYFSEDFSPPAAEGKTVIVVDDGIATGLTMEAAVQAARAMQPQRIVVAVPVASLESIDHLEKIADEVVVLDQPAKDFSAVGNSYLEFDQVDDEEVITILKEAHHDLQQSVATNANA